MPLSGFLFVFTTLLFVYTSDIWPKTDTDPQQAQKCYNVYKRDVKINLEFRNMAFNNSKLLHIYENNFMLL